MQNERHGLLWWLLFTQLCWGSHYSTLHSRYIHSCKNTNVLHFLYVMNYREQSTVLNRTVGAKALPTMATYWHSQPTNYYTDNGHTIFCWYDYHMPLHQVINLSNYMYWCLVSNLTGENSTPHESEMCMSIEDHCFTYRSSILSTLNCSWVKSHITIELKTLHLTDLLCLHQQG